MIIIFTKLKRYINENTILKATAFVLVISCICAISYVILFKITNVLNSDSASEIILAKEVLNAHSFFPKEWYYSTEIRVLNLHLIMALFLKFCNNLLLAKKFANIIQIFLLILSYCFFMKSIKVRKLNSALFLAALLTPFSFYLLDMMFIGAFYSTYMIFIFFILACINFVSDKNLNFKVRILLFLSAVLISYPLGLTGTRFLLNLYIPLLISECFILWDELRKFKFTNSINIYAFMRFGLAVLVTLSAFIGYKYFQSVLSHNLHFVDFGDQDFSALGTINSRFADSITSMLSLFGGTGSGKLLAFEGLSSVVNLFFIALLIIISAKLTLKLSKLSTPRRALLIFFYVSLISNIYILTFTSILITPRYHINCLLLLFPIGALFLDEYRDWSSTVIRPLILITTVVCIILSQYNYTYKQAIKKDANANLRGVITYLEENNLNFGYATFWNANISTVLSKGKVELAILDGNVGKSPFLWLTPQRIYSKSYHPGKTFLLLADDEVKKAKSGLLDGSTIATHINNYTIYVYQENPFNF